MCLPQTAAVDDANSVEQTHKDHVEVGSDHTYLVHNAVGNCSVASGMSKESQDRPCQSTAQGSVMSMEKVTVSKPRVTGEPASMLMCLPGVRITNQVDVGSFSLKLVHDDVGTWTGEIMSKVEEPAMLLSNQGLDCMSVMEEAYAPVGGVLASLASQSQTSRVWRSSPVQAWLESASQVIHIDEHGPRQDLHSVRVLGEEVGQADELDNVGYEQLLGEEVLPSLVRCCDSCQQQDIGEHQQDKLA